MSGELLETFVLVTPANTKTRVRACMAAGALAKFAGIEFEARQHRGNYSPGKVAPYDLPSDEAIACCRD